MNKATGRLALVTWLVAAGNVVMTTAPGAALVPPPSPSPVTVVSSVIGSLDEASAATRAAAVAGTSVTAVEAGTGSLAAAAPGAPIAGPVLVAATGLYIGFEGANAIMRAAGISDVGLEALFPSEPDPAWLPNGDLGTGHEPGWTGYSVVPAYWKQCTGTSTSTCNASGSVANSEYVVLLSGPAFGVTGQQVYAATIRGPGNPFAHGIYAAGSVSPDVGSSTLHLCYTNGQCYQMTSAPYWVGGTGLTLPAGTVPSGKNMTSNASYVVDHVELHRADGALVAKWYPEGHLNRPADFDADPARMWQTRWTCSDGSSGVANSEPFTEAGGSFPAPVPATCTGSTVTGMQIWEVSVGAEVADVLWESWTPTQALIDWQTDYPQCSDGSCVLELLRKDATTGALLSCFANPNLCVNWWTDPARADNYQCRYAGQNVAIEECAAYSPTFNVATGTQVKAGDGTEVARPQPYADPATGEPQEGGDPAPEPDPGAEDGGCPPPFSWTSLFNPWWYYKGFTCGLEWAFVPSESTMTRLQEFRADASSRPPISYMVTGIDWISAAADGLTGTGSCSDGPFEMGGGDLPSFNLCEAAVAVRQTTWGGVLYGMVAASLVGTGLFLVWRRVAASFGGKR